MENIMYYAMWVMFWTTLLVLNRMTFYSVVVYLVIMILPYMIFKIIKKDE